MSQDVMFIRLRSSPMTATTLDIRPLTPERLPDLASLFDQGGDPKWCWCAYFRIRGFDFSKGSKERHRAAMEAATYATAEEDRAPGLVAYDGDEAVGCRPEPAFSDGEQVAVRPTPRCVPRRPTGARASRSRASAA